MDTEPSGRERITLDEPGSGLAVAQAEAAEPAPPGRLLKAPREGSTYAIVGLFLLGTVGFLYWAKPFFMPVVLALLLSFLLRPLVRGLARMHVPETLGAAVVLVLALFALGNGISRLAQPASIWMAEAPEHIRKVERKIRLLLRPAHQLNRAAAQVEGITAGGDGARTPQVELKRSTWGDMVFSRTTAFLTGAVETIVLLYFLLASGDVLLHKLAKVLPPPHDRQEVLLIAHEVQHNISTFLFTITFINACLGVVVGFALFLLGMPNPVLWGVMAGLLNFIPYFGPFAGVLVLLLAGLSTFDSLGRTIAPPLVYLGLHGVESNFITPMVLGRRLTLNPLVIFASLMFWTWLWGMPGALLAVPLLMMFKILCDHFRPLAPVGELLSG